MHLCACVCLLFQALMQLQAEIDNANQLVKSRGEDKVIDIALFMKTTKQLETVADSVSSWVAEGSPVALAAKQLISNLHVKAWRSITAKSTQI